MNLNELRDKAYKIACEHGFHDKDYSNEHWLMLVVTELSEAVEADRKGNRALVEEFNFGVKYPKNNFKLVYDYTIRGSVEEELADTTIRLLDLAGLKGIDVSSIDSKNFVTTIYTTYTFTEWIFAAVRGLSNQSNALDVIILFGLWNLFALAKHFNIDLLWHINQKMRYNELRPRLHGKEY